MKPIINLLLFASIITMSFPSCYHYHFKHVDSVNVNATNGDPTIVYHKNIYYWGIKEKIIETEQCSSSSFAEVKIKANFLQTLANVLTLGFWKPITVELYCQEPN